MELAPVLPAGTLVREPLGGELLRVSRYDHGTGADLIGHVIAVACRGDGYFLGGTAAIGVVGEHDTQREGPTDQQQDGKQHACDRKMPRRSGLALASAERRGQIIGHR
jgi:hypothetical protein